MGGGGDFAPSQIRGGKFRCGKFRGAPWILCGAPRQSPQCVLPVCQKFAENPEFRVGNFAVNLKREIKVPRNPPPLHGVAVGALSALTWNPHPLLRRGADWSADCSNTVTFVRGPSPRGLLQRALRVTGWCCGGGVHLIGLCLAFG